MSAFLFCHVLSFLQRGTFLRVFAAAVVPGNPSMLCIMAFILLVHVTRNVNLRLHLPVIGRSRIFIKGITTSYRVLN